LLVDHIGASGGPLFAVVAMMLGTLLTLRYGPNAARAQGSAVSPSELPAD
jgi:DHA1 family purine ribonucleoside efflux pump-like MFS transporter